MFDPWVKTKSWLLSVIPAEAGIQYLQKVLDSRLRGNDVLRHEKVINYFDQDSSLKKSQVVCFYLQPSALSLL